MILSLRTDFFIMEQTFAYDNPKTIFSKEKNDWRPLSNSRFMNLAFTIGENPKCWIVHLLKMEDFYLNEVK